MRRLCCALAICALFLGPVLAVSPSITKASYSIINSEAGGNPVSIAQYHVEVDQDLNLLELQDCAGIASCPPLDPCEPCNYASKTECARIANPTGQPDEACLLQCDPSYCDTSLYGEWETLDLPQSWALGEYFDPKWGDLGVLKYRLYIPQGQPWCNSSVLVRARSGLANVYDPPDLTILRAPLADEIDLYNYDQIPWNAGRDGLDRLQICPGESHPLYFGNSSAGTYFIYTFFGVEYANTSVQVMSLPPSSPPEDMSWCDQVTLPPPINSNTVVNFSTDGNYVLNYDSDTGFRVCIPKEAPLVYNLPIETSRFLARIDGPCPRFLGISQTDSQTFVGRNMFVSFNSSFTRVFDPPDFIVDTDFAPRLIALSFCPLDTSVPTYVTIRFDGDGPFRLFVSSDRRKFYSTPIGVFGNAGEQTVAVGLSVNILFPNSTSTPACSTRCIYSEDACSCQGGVSFPYNLVEPNPLSPVPQWYSDTTSYYTDNILPWAVGVPPAGPRVLTVSLLFSSSVESNRRLVNKALFQPEVLEFSHLEFTGQFSLVNTDLESIPIDIWHPNSSPKYVRTAAVSCSVEEYSAIKQFIDAQLEQIRNPASDITEIFYLLDAVSLRPPYLGCESLAKSLLTDYTTTRLTATDACIEFDLADPCCSEEADWAQCCILRDLNVTSTTVTPSINSILSQCPVANATADARCVETYLTDFASAQNSKISCGSSLPSPLVWRFTQCEDIWNECSNSIFGYSLMGEECVTDYDCESGYCNAPYTPAISQFPYASLTSPRGQRRVCQEPLCFYTCSKSAMRSTYFALIAAYQTPDCVAPSGVCTEAGYYQHFYDGNTPTCAYSCDVYSMARWATYPLDCNQQSDANACGTRLAWGNLTACAERLTCNWYDCVGNFEDNDACNTTCLSPAGICSVCRNDGTCFDDFANYDSSVVDENACLNAHACQLANGSIVNLDPVACAATFTCSDPCWDEQSQTYFPCVTSDQCLQAGKCSDVSLDNPFYPAIGSRGGACVLPPRTGFGAFCAGSYSDWQYVIADTPGCIVWDLNATDCLDIIPAGGYDEGSPEFVFKSHTAAECISRCGCQKQTTDVGTGTKVIDMASTVPSTPEYCASCSPPVECQPYFTWTPARWEAGSPRSLSWKTPQMIPAYEVRADVFDFANFSSDWKSTCSFGGPLWRARSLTYSQCRFNRIASSLEAVACACGSGTWLSVFTNTDAYGGCIAGVASSPPIGVGLPCPLVPQQLAIPPHTIAFLATSVSVAQGCTEFTAHLVPRSNFTNTAPKQKLSSYFAPKLETIADFEFTNSKSSVVGQVIGAGVLLAFNGTFTDVRLCLDVGDFDTMYYQLDNERFPLLDIAISNGTVTPLDLVMNIENGGYCGTLQELQAGVYVPVIHRVDWRTHEPRRVTRGEKAVLALSASLYFLSAIVYPPYFCIAFINSLGIRNALTTSLFWLPVLIAAANILRGVYFALLGADLLADATYVDVLLVELPTFIWFTATTLMVLFWVVFLASIWNENALPRIRRLKRAFWVAFAVVNVIMYAIFVAFVVVFSQLEEIVVKEQCQGRLSAEVVRRPKRIAFIVYQSVLAGIALLLAVAHITAGPLLSTRLHKAATFGDSERAQNTRSIYKLIVVAIIVAIAFALHAVFIFLLALKNPGIPYLVLVLLVLDLAPTAILLWHLPAPSKLASSTTSSGSRSSKSRQSLASEF